VSATAEQTRSTAEVAAARSYTPAFWLALAGLVVQGLAATMLLTMAPYISRFSGMMGYYGGMMGYYGGMMGGYYGAGVNGFMWGWAGLEIVALALGILGVWLMSSVTIDKVRMGSVVVLVAAVLGFPSMFGFWFGPVLMFIGAILGLTYSTNRS
jgi:hypothetical protein